MLLSSSRTGRTEYAPPQNPRTVPAHRFSARPTLRPPPPRPAGPTRWTGRVALGEPLDRESVLGPPQAGIHSREPERENGFSLEYGRERIHGRASIHSSDVAILHFTPHHHNDGRISGAASSRRPVVRSFPAWNARLRPGVTTSLTSAPVQPSVAFASASRSNAYALGFRRQVKASKMMPSRVQARMIAMTTDQAAEMPNVGCRCRSSQPKPFPPTARPT